LEQRIEENVTKVVYNNNIMLPQKLGLYPPAVAYFLQYILTKITKFFGSRHSY